MNFRILFITLCAPIPFALSFGEPSSCAELLLKGFTKSGVYTIYPRPWYKPIAFQVYCDMKTKGGGWTRRDDYEIQENFYRGWQDYKYGFGDLEKDFWLGNEHIFVLTNQDHVTLRVELEDFVGNSEMAEYTEFRVANHQSRYKLTVGGFHGDAVDALAYHNGLNFSTYDSDETTIGCATKANSAWWYGKCHHSNLNGLYLRGTHSTNVYGVDWGITGANTYSLKRTEMKIRPSNFLN